MDLKRKRNENEKINHVCPHCKKRRNGDCPKSSNKCFTCGETRHIKKNYPKLKDKDNAPLPDNLNAANAGDGARNNLV